MKLKRRPSARAEVGVVSIKLDSIKNCRRRYQVGNQSAASSIAFLTSRIIIALDTFIDHQRASAAANSVLFFSSSGLGIVHMKYRSEAVRVFPTGAATPHRARLRDAVEMRTKCDCPCETIGVKADPAK